MIKQILGVVLVAVLTFGCEAEKKEVSEKPEVSEKQEKTEKEEMPKNKFGVKVDEAAAITLAALQSNMGDSETKEVVVKGVIDEVCQMKGCWVNLKKEDGSTVRVKFQDDVVSIPKDAAGKEIMVHGVATMKTESLEELKHYAKDAGKSQAEIDAITETTTKISIKADGAVLK